MSKVWLVTGSASGLGREIAGEVLASGDRLLATARDPRQLNDLVQRCGEQACTAPPDVADEAAAMQWWLTLPVRCNDKLDPVLRS
jgi:NADP-dependent 3-hydroxy acid dehydrogenase YdfG